MIQSQVEMKKWTQFIWFYHTQYTRQHTRKLIKAVSASETKAKKFEKFCSEIEQVLMIPLVKPP